MRTLHYNKFIWFGAIIGLGLGSQIGRGDSGEPSVNLTMFFLAVLSMGYGFKLKRLAKRGIKDTQELKKKK
jgi:hypothetical protein